MPRSPYRLPSPPSPDARRQRADDLAIWVVWCAAWLAGVAYVSRAFMHHVAFDAAHSVVVALVVLAPARLLRTR